MNIFLALILIFSLIVVLLAIVFKPKSNRTKAASIQPGYKTLLEECVPFYQKLNDFRKKEFEERVGIFLGRVKITGVKTEVEDIDRILIASSAVIPIFNFPGWEYLNLHEVLLYPDSFNHDFAQQGEGRDVMGMVGSGALNHVMILSQYELRQAFNNQEGKTNTAIHEFVHLVDKTDGAIDGIPEFILDKKYIMPWLNLMQKEIEMIRESNSDINPYGATNQAEFFAVVSEYFFERPELFQEKHPELFELLKKIFRSPDHTIPEKV
jgi:Mlc titration factor MtfA (ptsG expression regulator)